MGFSNQEYYDFWDKRKKDANKWEKDNPDHAAKHKKEYGEAHDYAKDENKNEFWKSGMSKKGKRHFELMKRKRIKTHDEEKKETIKSFSKSETAAPIRSSEASKSAKPVVTAPKNRTGTVSNVRDKIVARNRRSKFMNMTTPGWSA